MFDAILTVARKKLGVGDDWRWAHSEITKSEDFILKGACFPVQTTTGRPNYRSVRVKDWDTVVVTKAEIATACTEYEEKTGLCSKCDGAGEVMHSYTTANGMKMMKCPRCLGSGKRGSNGNK